MSSNLEVMVYYPGKGTQYEQMLNEKKIPGVEFRVCKTEADITRWIEKADILFVNVAFPIQYIPQGKNLKWIQVMGNGVERFVMDIELPGDMLLTRIYHGFGEKISEYVLAHLFAISHNVFKVKEKQRKKKWEGCDVSYLKGEVLGVAGLGSIGMEIAQRAHCLGMRVIGFDLTRKENPCLEECYTLDQLPNFLSLPRYLVISLPLTNNTNKMFGMKEFTRMRTDAYLFNTSRGQIVVEADLITALKQGVIKGAVLDVFEKEPLPETSPLWEMENVTITPHNAGPSQPQEMVSFFLDNLKRYMNKEELLGLVDRSRGF